MESVVFAWNDQILNAIRTSRTSPPMAAYKLAAFHLAMFEAVNGVHRDYASMVEAGAAPPGASPAAALHAAAYRVLLELYGDRVNPRLFHDQYRSGLAELPADEATRRGTEWGDAVAKRVLEHCLASGKDDAIEWKTSTDPGIWRETPPFFLPALLPHWPHVKPFTLERPDQFRCPPPDPLDSPAYLDDWRQVKAMGSLYNEERSDYDSLSAVFWSDDLGTSTPAGHWNLIARKLASQRELSVDEQLRLFALLNLTLADAGIACWEAKYFYNYWRPETAIREADRDGWPETEPDPDWLPLMDSPPFPEYPSGHSAFSRSAAELLTLYFGTDAFTFSISSDQLPGAVRTYDSLHACAEEVGMSRLHGGIHFMKANVEGQNTGRAVARWVFEGVLRPRTGG